MEPDLAYVESHFLREELFRSQAGLTPERLVELDLSGLPAGAQLFL